MSSDPAVILHDVPPDRVLVWMGAEELAALRSAKVCADRYRSVLARLYEAATGQPCTWQDSPDQMIQDAVRVRAERDRSAGVVSRARLVLTEWGLSMDDGTRHVHNTDIAYYRRMLEELDG